MEAGSARGEIWEIQRCCCNRFAEVPVSESDHSCRGMVVTVGDRCVGMAIVMARTCVCYGSEVIVAV